MNSAGVISARVVPLVVLDDPRHADPLADALIRGGLALAEITLRTPAGLLAIEALAARDDFTVGAGTVITVSDISAVLDAGAAFVVSPGLDEEVVTTAVSRSVPILPGIATATELQRALRLGIRTVKLFPAAQLGGAAAVTALSGPFPDVRFLPSGGVNLGNAPEYLRLPQVTAISTSEIAPRSLVAAEAWSEVTERAIRWSALAAQTLGPAT